MSERIRELALRAGRPGYPRGESELQKFAELIVLQCADILIKEVEVALDASGNPVSPEDFIKEHFGVEE